MFNPPSTFYSIVPHKATTDAPSWPNRTKLTHKCLKLLCNFWKTHSFLGICLKVKKQIHIFLTLLFATSNYPKGLMNRFFWIMRFLFFFQLYFWKFERLQVPVYFVLDYALNFILFYSNYNRKIFNLHLPIVSFCFILITGGWSMNR